LNTAEMTGAILERIPERALSKQHS
jgi:hypothetical protein